MKRFILLLAILVIVVGAVSARPGTMTIGPKFALNFATEGGDNSSYIKSSTKFGIGGFFTYDILDQFGVQGELLYNRKGCDITAYNPVVTVTGSYLDIVALAKYMIPIEGNFKPNVFAGPSLGLLLGATIYQGSQSADYSSNVSGADFGLIFGAGAAYKVGPGSIVFDLRYYVGLSNVNKDNQFSNTNQIFSINTGYAFPL